MEVKLGFSALPPKVEGPKPDKTGAVSAEVLKGEGTLPSPNPPAPKLGLIPRLAFIWGEREDLITSEAECEIALAVNGKLGPDPEGTEWIAPVRAPEGGRGDSARGILREEMDVGEVGGWEGERRR